MQYKPPNEAASINKFSIQNCSKEVANRNIGSQPKWLGHRTLTPAVQVRVLETQPDGFIAQFWESIRPASGRSWVRPPLDPPIVIPPQITTAKTWIFPIQLPPTLTINPPDPRNIGYEVCGLWQSGIKNWQSKSDIIAAQLSRQSGRLLSARSQVQALLWQPITRKQFMVFPPLQQVELCLLNTQLLEWLDSPTAGGVSLRN